MTTASLSPACDSDSCSHASTNSVSPRDITRANLAVRGQGRNKVSSRRKGNIAASPTWGCADKEAWRSDPRAARELGDAAVGHLRSALERPYAIYPRPPSFAKREGFHGLPPSADLPVLTVTPLEVLSVPSARKTTNTVWEASLLRQIPFVHSSLTTAWHTSC